MKKQNQILILDALTLGHIFTNPETGSVYRRRKNWGKISYKPIKVEGRLCNGGYRQMELYVRGQRVCVMLHNIIWLDENRRIKNRYVINHKNHNKIDNRISNLEEITQSENMKKAYQHKKHWRTKQ